MKKRPDRFEQIIAKMTGPSWCPDPEIPKGEVLAILRRQHAAYVRMVKVQRDRMKSGAFSVTNVEVDRNCLRGNQHACNTLLTTMAIYKRGTK